MRRSKLTRPVFLLAPLVAASMALPLAASAEGAGIDQGQHARAGALVQGQGAPGLDVDTRTAGAGSAHLGAQRGQDKGVPGIDVDLDADGRAESNGVPGVDMDIGRPGDQANNGLPGSEVDTRTAGAGAASLGAADGGAGSVEFNRETLGPRADRN